MEEKPLNDFVWFGTCIRFLQDVSEGAHLHDIEGRPPGALLYNLDKFFHYLADLNLNVTWYASSELWSLYNELKGRDKDATLTQDEAAKLNQAIRDIRRTLQAELRGFGVFVVTPKRIDITKLIHDVPFLLAPKVFGKLPRLARYDLNEAGKCIAFERPTAAAFHLLRATESVLREFYSFHVKRGRVATANLLWGNIVSDLHKKTKFKGKEGYSTLFNNLDNIRLSFRNPTQHPDKIYDIQEVQDLWGLCVDVINRMSKDLPDVESSS